MKRLILVGSPRSNGRSAHLAEMLFEANIDERPEDELFLVPVSEVEIGPCIACDGCREKSGVILKGDGGEEITVQRHRCVFDDDMQTLYDLLDDIDELTVVSPVFFSGAPAQLKCALDRLQPYYWANTRASDKRPASLHVIGEGKDPYGYAALLSETASALAVAGFRLERVFDWVGKIDAEGEILEEAEEVSPDGGKAAAADNVLAPSSEKAAGEGAPSDDHVQPAPSTRPKLNLAAGLGANEPAESRRPHDDGARRGDGEASTRKPAHNEKPPSGKKPSSGKKRGGASPSRAGSARVKPPAGSGRRAHHGQAGEGNRKQQPKGKGGRRGK